MSEITIKRLMRARQFEQAVELQKVYWGEDASNLVPSHVLHTICHHGGHLLGAYDGARLVGFVMGFFGTATNFAASSAPRARAKPAAASAGRAADNLLILSKRMLVLPHYRGREIGFKLKMAQRDIAIEQGIDLVTWTVDPLLAANAHFNFRKLGAVSSRFAVNYFDLPDSESLYADRLIVLWRVQGKRAQACAAGTRCERSLEQYLDERIPIINVMQPRAAAARDLAHGSDVDNALLELPADIRQLDSACPQVARRWRAGIRAELGRLVGSGFVVWDFVRADKGAYYYLSRVEEEH